MKTARLVESREVAAGVRHFVFEVEGADEFVFDPGQFVSLSGEIHGKSITRAYSLAGVPDGRRFELCLNRVEGGLFSPHLFDLRLGDRVNVAGPLGYFVWRRPVGRSVLVATGTGVAPFRGMLQKLWSEGCESQVTLVFGVRYEENLLYRAEFEQMVAEHENFRFWPSLSRPGDSWGGRRGHVQAHVLEAVGEKVSETTVYICGLKAMVDDLRAQLKGAGLERKQIVYEKYD